MTNEKKTASLSDIEGAFLIYKWITQNININCADYNKEESPVQFINQELVVLLEYLLYLILCVQI